MTSRHNQVRRPQAFLLPQLLLPTTLQLLSRQAVVWIDGDILATSHLHVVVHAFQTATPLRQWLTFCTIELLCMV